MHKIIHKAVSRQIDRFGVSATLTTTLCGRMSLTEDGMNSGTDKEVTCKLCLREMSRKSA